jgi:hypothetical protein
VENGYGVAANSTKEYLTFAEQVSEIDKSREIDISFFNRYLEYLLLFFPPSDYDRVPMTFL